MTATQSASTTLRGPLAGIRIIDATGVVVGPVATLMLAEQGADVIKVEPPGGDLMRSLGGRGKEPGMSPKFVHLNRNKRSIVLDLKSPDDVATARRLIAGADVFVNNMRPRALAALKLTWADLGALNPRLIHCTVTGFATGGPYEGAPAYDTVIQGLSGVSACFAQSRGQPQFAPFVFADHITGIVAAQAICAALVARERSGRGQAVEVPMFENIASFVLSEHLGERTFGPQGPFGDRRILDPHAQPIRTRDGFICVSANTDRQAHAFFRAIGRPELVADPRFSTVSARVEHVTEYFRIRAEVLLTRTTSEWLEVLGRCDIPAMRYNTLEDVVADPQLRASGVLVEESEDAGSLGLRHANRYSLSGIAPSRTAPRLNQDAEAILAEL